MQSTLETQTADLDFKFLPSFARYLLNSHLEEYGKEQLRLSREIEIPFLKHFASLSDKELAEFSKKNNTESLRLISENRTREQIEKSNRTWINDQIPFLSREAVVAEDMSKVSYMRKQAFLKFIPAYTHDPKEILNLVKEIDQYILESDRLAMNTYIDLLQNRINEHAHFIQRITRTSPGSIYVYDHLSQKEIYSNHKLKELLGYINEELEQMGDNRIDKLMHPEDLLLAREFMRELQNLNDGEIRSYKYRLRDKKGNYKWMRNYESVFKRTEKGEVWQTIGISLDIDKEKYATDELRRSEEQLLQAQEIANVGSFEWDLLTQESTSTPQVQKILELNKGGSLDEFLARVHPSDQARVKIAVKESIETMSVFDCEFRFITSQKEKIIWSHGVIEAENGRAVKMKGTIMDVTDRHHIIQRLQRSEELYKQAQALTHIGNYTWDLKTNKINWSDELYRIYGLEPQVEDITFEKIFPYNHPDDLERVRSKTQESIKNHEPFDFTYRIIMPDQTQKILHARGEILVDENTGQAYKVHGTTEDVTEREELIAGLLDSKELYKQAQSIAQVGNWAWDVKENKITWSEELYRIFGADPERKIDYQTYVSMIYPDDLPNLQRLVERALKNKEPYEFHHRVQRKDGSMRILRSLGEPLIDANGEVYKLVGTAQDVTEKEELIKQLQRSDELYKQAQAMAHIGNWELDPKSGICNWTDELFRIYGLEPRQEGIASEEFMELVHPDDRKLVRMFTEQALKTRQPFEMYHRNMWKDGTIKTLHIRGDIKTDEGGTLSIFGTTQDVTEQQEIEQQLRENQNFIKKIADATPSIITTYNINTGQYRFISGGLQKLLGFDPEQALKEGIDFFINIIHPDDLQPTLEKNSKALETANAEDMNGSQEFIVEFRYRMRHTDGQYRWFHTYGTVFDRNAEGKVENVLNISLDITERIKAEEKIKEQEHFIQNIADASPTILFLYDVQKNKIDYVNQEMSFALGYLPEEIIEMGPSFRTDLYHPEDIPKLPEQGDGYADLAEDENSMFQYECRMKAKNGEWRWLLVREIIFTRTKEGKPLQVLGAALDISERKEIEQKLYEKNIQLEQSNTSLEEFAYVASHDLQEPLRKISVFGDRLLAVEKQISADNRIYLNKIIDSSIRMQKLIDDLLIISRISNDKSFQTYSLQSVLDEVLVMLDHKIENSNAVISVNELPVAKIIPSQFRQLFQNLLSNSLKFINKEVEPKIDIAWSYIPPREVSGYSISKSRRYLKITFTDNGIGFENEYASRIFAIFQRLHGRAEYEGTGIGLAICKKIVENHGGTIFATSNGRGSVFTIIIPS